MAFDYKYTSNSMFPYATGYCGVFPKGLENRRVGEGSLIIEEDYIIFVKSGTPDEIKDRFIKEYAEYYAKKKMAQMNGIDND